MDNQPLVSIGLPAFNAEQTLGDSIASVLLQTYQNWEMLVFDDGSSDQTAAVARSFKDRRIKIFSDGANKGLSARLNEAIDKSSGKYFARMDSDDLCFPDRLQKQVEFLEGHPDIDLLATRAMTFITPGHAIGLFPFRGTHEEICGRPWNGFYMPHPTWMGRLDWFRKHHYRMPEVKRAEDQELLLRTYPSSRFACLPEVLFAYRVRSKLPLKINTSARKSVLQSQLRLFAERAQWKLLALAVLAYCGKRVKDLYGSLAEIRAGESGAAPGDLPAKWEELKLKIAQVEHKA